MKILVPTDFSEIAHQAFKIALNVSGLTEGSVHVFHSLNYPENWKDYESSNPNLFALAKLAESEAQAQIDALKIEADRYEIDFTSSIEGKKFIQNLKSNISEHHIDLVIMGSYGLSGASEWYIGSNAQKVVRTIPCNVLVVKEEESNLDFEKTLFATDLKSEDKNALRSFLDFVKIFGAKEIHILAINTMGYFSQPTIIMNEVLEEFKEIVTDIHCETHFYKDVSVQKGIRNFSEKHQISLIGISNHERHPIKRIFQGSNVEMLINHAHTPVLALNHLYKKSPD